MKKSRVDWRDGSSVKISGCSSRGPAHMVAHTSVALLPGDPTSSHRHIDIYAGKTPGNMK